MSDTNEVINSAEETAQAVQETTQVVQKKKKWLIPVIIGAAVALLAIILAVVLVIALTVSAPKRALKKQLNLGEKYLTELDYENAILAYEEALRIDPNNEEAYLALVGIYETLAENSEEENLRQAMEYASKGLDTAKEGLTHIASSAALLEKERTLTAKLEEYDQKDQQSLIERIAAVKATGLADEIIVEEYEGQKIDDIRRLGVEIFTVGSDWVGHFDYLNEFCKVIYLPRTEGVSSSEIRAEKRKLVIGTIGKSGIAYSLHIVS